ncbi:MAG: hypothetical protein LUD03_03935 [Firmicutes bacterium]|nr:hypothetical protein [Bacillota bacterium]
MYIMDVIETADRLYPNEYTTAEKIRWIDELNAKIASEYRKIYKAVDLRPDSAGEYLAPEGVTWESIHSLRVGAREIKKEDFATFGVKFVYGVKNRLCVPTNIFRATDVIRVIYLEAAEEIRVINLDDVTLTFDENGFYIDKEVFLPLDVVNIKGTIGGTEIDKNVNVFRSYLPEVDSTVYYVEVDEGAFSDYVEDSAEGEVSLRRLITEKTICPTGYDDMYIQWVCAKICYWQKAFDSYNQHMTVFNQLLSDYWHYVLQNAPERDNDKWRGWI